MDIQEVLRIYGLAQTQKEQTGNRERRGEKDTVVSSTHQEGSDQNHGNPGKVLTRRSFADALTGKGSTEEQEASEDGVPLDAATPQLEGGNITVTIDEAEYAKGLHDNKFNIIGRLIQQGGEKLTTLGLRQKLEEVWGFSSFRVIPTGRGFFQVFFKSMAEQSLIMSIGTVPLKLGIFRVSRWVPDFNPESQLQTNAQVWVRIVGLPIEYWRPANLCSIARVAGLPLKIDRQTLNLENCIFARLLVDVDLRNKLPEEVLVKRQHSNFFVTLVYEKVPNFCEKCCNIGHTLENYRRVEKVETQGVKNGGLLPESGRKGRDEPSYWRSKERLDAKQKQGVNTIKHHPTTANEAHQKDDQGDKNPKTQNNNHARNNNNQARNSGVVPATTSNIQTCNAFTVLEALEDNTNMEGIETISPSIGNEKGNSKGENTTTVSMETVGQGAP